MPRQAKYTQKTSDPNIRRRCCQRCVHTGNSWWLQVQGSLDQQKQELRSSLFYLWAMRSWSSNELSQSSWGCMLFFFCRLVMSSKRLSKMEKEILTIWYLVYFNIYTWKLHMLFHPMEQNIIPGRLLYYPPQQSERHRFWHKPTWCRPVLGS